jgi:membrane protein
VTNNFAEHRMPTYAAALAYRGLFGLFPFMLLLVVLLSIFGPPDAFGRIVEDIKSQSSEQVPQQLEPVVEQGREQIKPLEDVATQAQKQADGELLLIGLGFALWSVSALANTLADAFNRVHGLVDTLRALFVLLWGWLRFPVALVLLWLALSFVYRYSPAVNQPLRSVWLGAALAVLAWAVASVGFSVYLANFADYGVTYGSLGAAVGLLVYLDLSASIVLAGAELNAALRRSSAE